MRFIGTLIGAMALVGLSSAAMAAPIEYDLTVTGSGTITNDVGNGTTIVTPFSGSTGVFRYIGETTAVTGGSFYRSQVTGSFTLAGITGSISGPLNTPEALTSGTAPGSTYISFPQNGTTTFNITSPAFLNYNLQTALPTVSFTPLAQQNPLRINNGTGTISFSSISAESFGASTPSVLGTPGPIAGAGLVPLLGLAGAYLFGRKRLAA